MATQYLSKEEAGDFVKSQLGVDLNISNKHEFLSKIVSRFMEKIPFQNLTFMAAPVDQREIPTAEECVKSVLEGYGGVCFALNSVMYFILKALDFDAHLLLCSVAFPSKNDHAAVLIRNLKTEGDNWLVDVGFGSPCFEPINMDFDSEGETITQSHVTYKYEKRGDSYIRLHKVSKGVGFPTVENGWTHAYYFTLKPTDLRTISDSINKNIYKTVEGVHFHVSPRVIAFSNKKAVFFKDGFFLKEGEDGKLQKEDVTGDVAEVVHNHYPTIPIQIIKAAISTFQNLQK